MRYFVLGAKGMAGHLMAFWLKEHGEEVVGFARTGLDSIKTFVGDAHDMEFIKSIISSEHIDVVVNCIGILNKAVDDDMAEGIYINSCFPHLLAKICSEAGIKLIHISTDCIFSGNAEKYDELSIADANSYYGRTKYLGEVYSENHLTIRTSIIGPELKSNGIGLFHWFMMQKGSVTGFCKAMWSGVTTIELAKAVQVLSHQKVTGLYHLTNNKAISKYQLLCLFNQVCRNKSIEIVPSYMPVNSKVLVCTRTDVAYQVPAYEKMVYGMHEWIHHHKDFYQLYADNN